MISLAKIFVRSKILLVYSNRHLMIMSNILNYELYDFFGSGKTMGQGEIRAMKPSNMDSVSPKQKKRPLQFNTW